MLKEQKYSVLIASSNEKFDQILLSLLPANEYGPVDIVNSAGAARRKLLDMNYDILIVNAPLKDERGANFAVDSARETGMGIMLLLDASIFDEVSPVAEEYGVLCLSKPTNRAAVTSSLRLLCATRQRLKRMEKKASSFEEKIQEIKLVNRAKLLLMEKADLSEEDAHRFIEKMAMDSRSPKVEIAKEIITRYKE